MAIEYICQGTNLQVSPSWQFWPRQPARHVQPPVTGWHSRVFSGTHVQFVEQFCPYVYPLQTKKRVHRINCWKDKKMCNCYCHCRYVSTEGAWVETVCALQFLKHIFCHFYCRKVNDESHWPLHFLSGLPLRLTKLHVPAVRLKGDTYPPYSWAARNLADTRTPPWRRYSYWRSACYIYRATDSSFHNGVSGILGKQHNHKVSGILGTTQS